MQRVDAVQRFKCTIGSGPARPTRFLGQGRSCCAEVETFMEHCAKRWQTKEGSYQLKRRRLLQDVRDPPEQGNADVDVMDI